ncbi:MAG: hypothetical protein D6729_06550 [Deltaproteobacteria bacterium]|nr:MAG: hypothetical protein D6729_06550 [Deltaproteobacteria bacterium]
MNQREQGPNYTKAAFLNRINLAALAGAVGLSAATLSPIPLLIAAGAELLYLATVPGLPRYQRLVDSRFHQQRRLTGRQRDAEVYERLSPNQQATYDGLLALREQIEENYRRLAGGTPVLAGQSVHKIETLLRSFLRLLDQLNAYRRYLSATDRGRIEREIEELESDLGREESERLREIKSRRLHILKRRLERFEKGEENREIISHQLAAIEDVFRLIHEQSLTARDPQDISKQIDTLTAEIEETEDTVQEMESFLRLQEELDDEIAAAVRNKVLG